VFLLLSSSLFFIAAVIQWLFFTLIWERFIEDKIQQFVDLCTMANVSVFIMEQKVFGYYIHGRSPHGIADTGMKEMYQQLQREMVGTSHTYPIRPIITLCCFLHACGTKS